MILRVVAFLVLLTGPVAAQPALLRSGDHAEFTRLTLPLPADTSFALAETPGRAALNFSGSLREIDVTQVFDRIGRSRLASVSVAPGPVLELDLGCACPVETTLAASNLLIIDILNGPVLEQVAAEPAPQPPQFAAPPGVLPPSATLAPEPAQLSVSGPRFATGLSPQPAPILLIGRRLSLGLPAIDPMRPTLVTEALDATATASESAVPAITSPTVSRLPSDADVPLADTSRLSIPTTADPAQAEAPPVSLPAVQLPRSTQRPEAEDLVATLPGIPHLSPAEAQLTRELEQSLLAAIGNAATEGLLQPGPSSNELREDQRQISDGLADGTHPDPGLAATPSTFGSDKPDGTGRIVLSGNPCALFMPPLVAVEGMDFITELSMRRSRLTGERDRDDVAAYHDLAHFYLLYGFGPEAGSVLASVQQPPREAAEMASIARILEHGHDPEPSPFTGRMTCDTDAALWAALARPQIPPGSDFDGDAIKRSLLVMPNTLKGIVGPLLAERFLDAREEEFAREILRIVERNLPDISGRQALAEAKLAAMDGPPDAEAFHALIAQNSDVSPEALLHYTNSALDHGQVVNAETIGLLESYRTQYRDAPLAADLTRAEIIARSASGNFPAAFALYDQQREKLMPDVQDEVINGLARNLASQGSDAVFTRAYFGHAAEIAAKGTPGTLNAVADRLIGLGLPEIAAQLLEDTPGDETARARALLRARAALAMNLPRRAEAELEGLTGEDAIALRAEARLAAADFRAAESLFSEAGQSEAAAEAAWLARNWQGLREDGEPARSRLAGVVTTQQEQPVMLPDIGPPTLAASREVLGRSGETRAALRDLLATVEIDQASDP